MLKHTLLNLITIGAFTIALTPRVCAQSPGLSLPGMDGMRMVPDTATFTPNSFIGSFRMEMKVGEAGKQEVPNTIHYFSNSEKTLMRMPQGSTLIDHKAKLQYVLMDTEGGKRAMRMPKMRMVFADNESTKGKVPQFKETGETRTIQGHVCSKVIALLDDGTWTGWVTEDIRTPFADIMRSMSGRVHGAKDMDKLKGFPLEYLWTSTDGKRSVACTIDELKVGSVDEGVFSLDGYSVLDMPAMPGMGR